MISLYKLLLMNTLYCDQDLIMHASRDETAKALYGVNNFQIFEGGVPITYDVVFGQGNRFDSDVLEAVKRVSEAFVIPIIGTSGYQGDLSEIRSALSLMRRIVGGFDRYIYWNAHEMVRDYDIRNIGNIAQFVTIQTTDSGTSHVDETRVEYKPSKTIKDNTFLQDVMRRVRGELGDLVSE